MAANEDSSAHTRRVMSRRTLLRAAPAAALGGAAVTLAASPAGAATGDPLLLGQSNGTTALEGDRPAGTSLTTPLTLDSLVVAPVSNPYSGAGPAVVINAPVTGYHPYGQDGLAVTTTDGGTGISVNSGDGPGYDSVPGAQGTAISATVDAGQVLVGQTTSTTAGKDAVTLTYAGTSRAVYAESTLATNINGTITGVNDGSGIGVWGEHKNPTTAGIGVVGVGDAHGRGAQFSGGAANARLTPAAAGTHPTTGKAGDLFVDSSVRLWFCQKSSTGAAAAVWKQIA